jgi:hypothetical protein
MLNAGLRMLAAGAIMLPALNWVLPAAAAELELAPPVVTERVVARSFMAPRARIASRQFTNRELIRVAVRDDLPPAGCVLCTGLVLGVGF